MRITPLTPLTPLTRTGNTSVYDIVSPAMRKFFGKKRLSWIAAPDPTVTVQTQPASPPPPPPAPPSYSPPRSHGLLGTSPPSHPPPNASGYVSSYALVAGNSYAPARPTAGHSDAYRTPRSEHRKSLNGGPPAHHINDIMGGFDSGRDELFGGATQRAERQQQALAQGLNSPVHGVYGASRPEAANYTSYDPERQLTAEEEEEEDVEAIKSQIRFTKRQTVASTETALRAAAQAEETGLNTLARLGTQGDSLQNTRKNLALASSHNRVAAEKTRELKKANGSMFAIHVKNPLRHTARAEAEEAEILALHQAERAGRAELRADEYESRSKIGKALNDTSGTVESRAKTSLAERARFQFEADESDDDMEHQIGTNLEMIAEATGRLKGLAVATGIEVGRQVGMVQGIRVEVMGSLLWFFYSIGLGWVGG